MKSIDPGGWLDRKLERKKYYEKYVLGWKSRKCSACAGSGHYDSGGSPKCSGCNGTGKERYKPSKDT